MNIYQFILTIFFISLLSGCATGPISKMVLIESFPTGAEIYVNGNYEGFTPLKRLFTDDFDFSISGTTDFKVQAFYEGYEPGLLIYKDQPYSNISYVPDNIKFHLMKKTNNDKEQPSISTTYQDQNDTSKNDKAFNSWAIIVGISKYQYSGQNGLTNLIFADDDAKVFTRALLNLGWSKSHIKLLTNENATERNIKIALKSWLTKAGPNDQIILFWAGHGYPDPGDPEKVYLATYDTDIDIPATGYRMDEVRKALEEIGSRNVILFADTCHAGKLITRGDRGISIVPNIKQKIAPKGWVFMVGADTDRQAIEDSSWSNGAFTHSLVNGLNGAADGFQSIGPKDGVITLGELRAYMNTAMPEETQKVIGVAKRPVITTNTGDPDIWNLSLNISN